MISAALSLCYAGFVAFCLAVPKHHKQILGRNPSPLLRLLLRAGGGIALVLALSVCAKSAGWPIGSVIWFGLLSVASLTLVFLLPYAPRSAVALGLLGLAYSLTVKFAWLP